MAELRLYKIAHPAILCDLIALVLVVLIQRKWTNWESWFLVVFALMVIAVVVGLGRH